MDALSFHRMSRKLMEKGVPWVPGLLRKAARVLYTAYLPSSVEVGEGTLVGYGGAAILVHPNARIGRYCVLSPMVLIGGRSGLKGGAVIGDYVRIGAGAKILGPVKIGDFAVIGANAVVTKDVPPGTVVAGVPARELRRMADPVAEYERNIGREVLAVDRARAPRLEPWAGGGKQAMVNVGLGMGPFDEAVRATHPWEGEDEEVFA